MVTAGWLSAAVENTSDFLVGIVVFASISFVNTDPIVSIPRESGVTSNSNTSFTSPVRTPPWIAAPIATTSSGFTPLEGAFPKNFSTASWIAGILVEPPTKIISSISETLIPALAKADLQGSIVLSIRLWANCSNFALGPEAVAVMYGRLISVCVEEESSTFAFSAASFNLWSAIGSVFKSTPSSFLNSSAIQSMITLSKSSPPRWVSPSVAFTSKEAFPSTSYISNTETSCVPPPQSNTTTFMSFLPTLSNP